MLHFQGSLHQNQPYDESLDVPDAESQCTPSPRVLNPLKGTRVALQAVRASVSMPPTNCGHPTSVLPAYWTHICRTFHSVFVYFVTSDLLCFSCVNVNQSEG